MSNQEAITLLRNLEGIFGASVYGAGTYVRIDNNQGFENDYRRNNRGVNRMAEKELFGNSEQLNDLISRRAAINALKNRWKKTRNYEGIGDDIAEECELYLKQVPSAQPGWIPVTERLPEKDGEYLVTMLYFGEKTVEVDRFSHYETDDEHNGEPFWMYGYDNVIAWMPRPEAWKGDTP